MNTITIGEPTFSYDRVPYESHPFPQSHPDRLATLGTLFGMQPAPVATCRVLELACASGGNIIPFAQAFPEARCVGVDLSSRQVATGQALVQDLGLKNIELKHMNLLDVDASMGKFHYIIAHGLYAWVPDEVQNKILSICHDLLEPNGIAYVSYNTYPGWHFRGMLRDMMMFHTRGLPDPAAKTQQARALLDFLAQSVPPADNAYGMMLKKELEMVRQVQDYYLYHDFLEDENKPLYFHQFAEAADRHGLQFLSEAEFSTMLTSNMPPQVADTLRRVSNNIINTEQYMDFVRNRMFRQTLLCHKGVQLHRNLGHQNVRSFLVSSPARPSGTVDLNSSGQDVFDLPNNRQVRVGHPLAKAAFLHLQAIWPRSATFEELLEGAVARLQESILQQIPAASRAEVLGANLLSSYAADAVIFRTVRPEFTVDVADRPKVSPLARAQARTQARLTNRFHESVPVDFLSRHFVMLMDGTRTQSDIIEEMLKQVQAGTLNAQREGKPLTEPDAIRDAFRTGLNQCLAALSKAALLIP